MKKPRPSQKKDSPVASKKQPRRKRASAPAEPAIIQPNLPLGDDGHQNGRLWLELTPARVRRLEWFRQVHWDSKVSVSYIASYILDVGLAENMRTSDIIDSIIDYALAEGIDRPRQVLLGRLEAAPKEIATVKGDDDDAGEEWKKTDG